MAERTNAMLTNETKRKLVAVLFMVAPIIALKAFSAATAVSGPAQALADYEDYDEEFDEGEETVIAKRSPTDDEVSAWQYIKKIDARFGASPFGNTGLGPVLPTAAVTDTQDARPTFQLDGILSGPHGTTAMINGEIYRAGERIATGWRVATIDSTKRLVIIAGPDFRRIRIYLPVR